VGTYLYPVSSGPRDDQPSQRVIVVADEEPVARGRVGGHGARGFRLYRDRSPGRAIPLRLDRRFATETRQHRHSVAAIGYAEGVPDGPPGVAGFLA
jgi:hypothetical protein